MDFVNPHAILLSRENLYDIHRTTNATFEALDEYMKESADMQMPFYVVGWRKKTDGLPTFDVLTEVQLCVEYRLGAIPPNMKTNFTKL